MTISARLKEELSARGWSTNKFQEEVRHAAPGARGVSYASVYEYVEGKEGKPEPPLSFLRAAADVLGIRLAYLIDGELPRTRQSREMREAVDT